MLRFATWKIVAILALTFAAMLVVAPSLLSPSNYEALAAKLPDWARPPTIVLGLDLQGGSQCHAGGRQAVRAAHPGENLRDDVRRILREEKVAMTGGIGAAGARRAVPRRRCRRPRKDHAQAAGARARATRSLLGGRRAAARDRRRGRRPGPHQRDRRRRHRKGAPRRRSVDRGDSPPHRRARHEGAEHSAPGRRPHHGAGAGPPRSRAAEDDPRPDGQARIPPGRRTRPKLRPKPKSSTRPSRPARSPSRSR